MTPIQIISNIVGGMLLIQVILGGAATIFNTPVISHSAWGFVSFLTLLVLVYLIV